jgi:hypothetical protein
MQLKNEPVAPTAAKNWCYVLFLKLNSEIRAMSGKRV